MQSQTTVTKRWQTVIPAAIRKQMRLKEGDKLVWLFDGVSIRVVHLSADPIAALRGTGKGKHLGDRLLAGRKEDLTLENRKREQRRPK